MSWVTGAQWDSAELPSVTSSERQRLVWLGLGRPQGAHPRRPAASTGPEQVHPGPPLHAGMCSLPAPQEPLRRVAVTGGTHGNEMSGVCLARYWLQAPRELQRPSFSAMPVLANLAATAACRRYVDCDLNRAFTGTFLT